MFFIDTVVRDKTRSPKVSLLSVFHCIFLYCVHKWRIVVPGSSKRFDHRKKKYGKAEQQENWKACNKTISNQDTKVLKGRVVSKREATDSR